MAVSASLKRTCFGVREIELDRRRKALGREVDGWLEPRDGDVV